MHRAVKIEIQLKIKEKAQLPDAPILTEKGWIAPDMKGKAMTNWIETDANLIGEVIRLPTKWVWKHLGFDQVPLKTGQIDSFFVDIGCNIGEL